MGKLKLNYAGFNELRKSAAVQQVITEKANSIRQQADALAHDPGGFEEETVVAPTRAVAIVHAASPKAAAMCRNKNVLLKAVGK